MKRWLWKLTGGRPMRFVQTEFVDQCSGRTVSLYADRLGRWWLAEGSCALFRVRANTTGRVT